MSVLGKVSKPSASGQPWRQRLQVQAPNQEAFVAHSKAPGPHFVDPPAVDNAAAGFNEQDGADIGLTPAQLAKLNHGSLRLLVRTILVQAAGTILVAGLAWWIAGTAAGLSALAGALVCTIPNALFALRLALAAVGIGKGSPVTFFLGEFLKLGASTALLVMAVRMAGDGLVWPALIAGLIVALKSHYIVLLSKNS